MRGVTGVVTLLGVLALAATAALAQFPGEPKTQYSSSYDPVGEMRRHWERGAPNEIVRDAQRVLRDAGYYAGEIDGIMGPDVKAAIWKFQKAKGLAISGSLDRLTLAELGFATGAYASPPSSGFGGARARDMNEMQAP